MSDYISKTRLLRHLNDVMLNVAPVGGEIDFRENTGVRIAGIVKKYEGKSFQPDSPEYYTARGERVRSKSEVIIADTLTRLSIPYRYEYPLTLHRGGRKTTSLTIYPDFLCLNLRTRQEFIWEHFGLMDNSAYSTSAVQKLQTYNQNDIHPGKSLIISTETADLPLNTKHIENIIQTYLK